MNWILLVTGQNGKQAQGWLRNLVWVQPFPPQRSAQNKLNASFTKLIKDEDNFLKTSHISKNHSCSALHYTTPSGDLWVDYLYEQCTLSKGI